MKIILLPLFLFITCSSLGQKKAIDEISIKLPFVRNKIEVTNIIGPERQIKGTGINYGINANILKYFDKKFFWQVGIGYFKNKFSIHRPFYYATPYQPLFTTKSYHYHCIQAQLGLGYKYDLNDSYSLKGKLNYSWFYTYKQIYYPETNHPRQVNKKAYLFGNSTNTSIGICRKIDNRFSFGVHLLIPIYTTLKKDEIFKENNSDSYHPKNNIGAEFELSYNF